jgi:hypothetical protein
MFGLVSASHVGLTSVLSVTHHDAWEWMDDPDYPAKFTGYAYRPGMNAIIYVMTHQLASDRSARRHFVPL